MNNFKKQHEDFIGEITAFLEEMLFFPIGVGKGDYFSDGIKGVLIKYIAVPYKDEHNEIPHYSFQLFIHYYKRFEEIEKLTPEEIKSLEFTMTLPYEPYTDKIWLDKPESEKEKGKHLVSEMDIPRDTTGSCTQCTLDYMCVTKTKINDLFTNMPQRLYPDKITVWHDILKIIGNKCPHFNLIIKKEGEK